jgi:hypothetical protein
MSTFDTLTDDDCNVLEAYRTDLEELFYTRYEVTWQRLILKDTTSIIIRKAEVTPKVWPNSSLSLDNVQSMINSALERQAKSSDELMSRLIEEQDGKKLADSNVNPSSSSCAVNFAQINPQTSGTSAGSTTMPNPSAHPMNHNHNRNILVLGCHNKLWPACSGTGTCTPYLSLLC